MHYLPLLLLPLAVSALPQAKSDLGSIANSLFCAINNDVVTALKQQATATSYCSSYLSIATKTFSATSTITPASVHVTTTTTVTGSPYITTLTVTETTVQYIYYPVTLGNEANKYLKSTDLHVPSTVTETDTATVTSTTSTVTLSCLSTAYTATPATQNAKRGVVQKPTCLPSSWAAPAISSACSCLSIPTPSTTITKTTTLAPGTVTDTATQTLTPTSTNTVTTTSTSTNMITDYTTVTTTTTGTVYATATTIPATGLGYSKYTHSFTADSANNGFTSSYFKTANPDFSGSLQNVNFATPNWPSSDDTLTLPGHDSFDSSYAAVLMQGFFVAPTTGTYTISTSGDVIDNWGYLWTGDVAYSTWSDGNTAYQAIRVTSPYVSGTTTFTLNAGDAIPVRLLWANGGGAGQSSFVITRPDGTAVSDSTGYFAPACSSVFS